jgi:GR25 family glycosyltransferase involved in LPS biosynthesis
MIKLKKSVSRILKEPKTYCDIRGGCYDNFESDIGVYVINCKMHKTRYEKLLKYTKEANVKVCRSPCILGKKFSNKKIVQMVDEKVISKNAEMTKVEVSINMSHYNCWQKLLNSCNEYALILEDDVELHDNFIENINLIMNKLKENDISFSILHLWNGNWAKTKSKQKKILKINHDITIMQEKEQYNAGAVAYIITKKYAKWLMNHFFPIKIPQDILIGNYHNRGKHLSVKMSWDKKQGCYITPLFNMECGGEGGTGSQTTQTYDAPTIKEIYRQYKQSLK